MCQVDSFCCGCAPLRKGALIIGSVKLVIIMLVMMMVMMMSVMMMITIMRMIPLGQSVIPPFDASDDDDHHPMMMMISVIIR